MDKIFDHRYPSRGWVEVVDAAKAIEDIFDEERWCDRDNMATYLVEHWSSETNKITYHVANVTGWYHGEAPEMTVSQTEDVMELMCEQYYKRPPTDLDPRRDYLKLPSNYGGKWPHKVT